jgi:hypothetical protein
MEFDNPMVDEEDDSSVHADGMSTSSLRRLFERVDENQSGCLDRDEVRQLAGLLGVALSSAELDASMAQMDDNGDGTIEFEEFEAWFRAREPDGLFPSLKVSAATIFKTSERLLLSGASMTFQPVKIFLSYWQIAGQMGVRALPLCFSELL